MWQRMCTLHLGRPLKGARLGRRYPGRKDESWWLLVGNAETNTLLTIKKVSMSKASVKSTLKFEAPAQPGSHRLTLYFMCDAYMGCDQVSRRRTVQHFTSALGSASKARCCAFPMHTCMLSMGQDADPAAVIAGLQSSCCQAERLIAGCMRRIPPSTLRSGDQPGAAEPAAAAGCLAWQQAQLQLPTCGWTLVASSQAMGDATQQ